MQEVPLSPATPPILIIEDHAGQLHTLADILTSEGLQPICCQTGQAALSVDAQLEVPVAILDLRLSDMNGLQLLDRLLKDRPYLKVIIHTGFASLDSAIAAINRGAFAYVQKEGNVEELLAHVHRAFHMHLAGYSKRLEAQLYQAQKMEAIGTLAGGIAHDFNNVLGAILINTELSLTLAESKSELSNYLQGVLTAATRAKDLIQQILTFSRQAETTRQPLQLAKMIGETSGLLRASLPTTINIRYDLPAEGCTIFANPTQIYQIMLNLCVNAEHAMRQTGGTLEIAVDEIEMDDLLARFHPELSPGSYVRLSVRDSGHGMPPEVAERIFEPYFTTKGLHEGTGMGLAMVHGIVASYDGAITVESALGKGATFMLYFPSTQAPRREDTPSEKTLPHGIGRILFVDDEPSIAHPASMLLGMHGYNVTCSNSSQNALQRFQADPMSFDLLITDQTMPDMTGLQLAAKVRLLRPDLPIILCTGFSHTINAEQAREAGIDAFCIKPLTTQDLVGKVQQVLHPQMRAIPSPFGQRILLIEDEEQLRQGLRRLLEAAGYEVVEASNGREGMQRYRTVPIDLIITNILMPEQEGLETIRQLRGDNPVVKIIAISGGMVSRGMDLLDTARRLGANRSLAKPFSRDELIAAVQDVLQG